MTRIFSKISIVVFLSLLLSFAVDFLYRQNYKINYQLPKNILPHPEIDEKYEIVKLGNSHAGDGLTFERYKLKSLALDGLAQSFEYDLAMLKMFSRQIKKDAVVIITVSPISFSQKKPTKKDNVNMNYYDGRLSPFLIPHFKQAEYLQIQIVPFVRAGYLWREKYAKEIEQKAMDAFAKEWNNEEKKEEQTSPTPTIDKKEKILPTKNPLPKTNTLLKTNVETTKKKTVTRSRTTTATFDVAKIQAEVEAPFETQDQKLVESAQYLINKWYNSGDFGTEYFDTNRKDLENIISFCFKNQWRPVLVSLPVSQELIDELIPNYLEKYMYQQIAKLDLKDIKYFDFASNPKLTKNKYFYANSDHLNKKGAAVVSYLLLKELLKANYLPKEADGYDYENL